MRNSVRFGLMMGAAAMALLSAGVGYAQETAAPVAQAEPEIADYVIVTGVRYRDRSAEIAPTLEYGLDYFQQFEPLTVGDMLKRTPSTAFISDVLEYDGVRLRGLDPGYTQILINGKKVPGSGVDRSFWVDRIPAELIERVEIVRSASADRSGDAVAGALNIVMRDSAEFDGGFIRGGALRFDDGEVKPVVGGVLSGPIGGGRGIAGFNIQGRHNPKEKQSFRYEPDGGVLEFDNREDQSDVRDGTDYSFNGEVTFPVGSGELRLAGFYVLTDRTEEEDSIEYGIETGFDPEEVLTVVPQFEDISQENYSIEAGIEQQMFGGTTELEVAFSRFDEDITSTEDETGYDENFPTEFVEFQRTQEVTDMLDDEWEIELSHERDLTDNLSIKFGVDYRDKQRDALITEAEAELEEGSGPIGPDGTYPEGYAIPALSAPEAITGGDYEISEQRLDGFMKLTGADGIVEWEAGVRYETTDSEITDREAGETYDNDYAYLLPSMHIRLNLTEDDRIILSGARTVRRPNFDYLAPALLEEEPTEDNDFVGNPELDPETAWGVDVGYERRLGRRGVVGVNVFYRDISDLVELASTGIVSSSGDGFVFTPSNVGDGEVWGIEFDLSTPLSFIGLDDTGVFLNYSWLDSEVVDPVTGQKRRFNDQAEYVFNAGFIQDLPSWAAAFGVSYRKQGDAFSRIAGETVSTAYDGDLEAFIEKRFGESFVLRLTGSNLLDASKDEIFHKWDTVADQLSGDINDLDEYEVETEKSGPVFQIVGRLAF